MRVDDGTDVLTIKAVVEAWDSGGLRMNREYQRGLVWSRRQQQMLVDSVLRGYPLPRFYFKIERAVALNSEVTSTHHVVDGQQRIAALSSYLHDAWPLLDPAQLPGLFPKAVREAPCPWASKRFSELPTDLQAAITDAPLAVALIDKVDSSDELRDLFIRLQAGTALTRQQVRDAWPGRLGPYIERLGGKLDKSPRYQLFQSVRKTDNPEDEEHVDQFLEGRQTCAQLLALFFARKTSAVGSLDAGALDNLYHSQTDFDGDGPDANQFERILEFCEDILVRQAPSTTGRRRAKVTKFRVFALFLAILDSDKAGIRVDRQLGKVGTAFWDFYWRQVDPVPEPRPGKSTSRVAIAAYFQWFEATVFTRAGLAELDTKRHFTEEQKNAIWRQSGGSCAICKGPLERWAANFDHIVPWVAGGPTEVANGQAVHGGCNSGKSDRELLDGGD